MGALILLAVVLGLTVVLAPLARRRLIQEKREDDWLSQVKADFKLLGITVLFIRLKTIAESATRACNQVAVAMAASQIGAETSKPPRHAAEGSTGSHQAYYGQHRS